jgi:hypothetical protein
LIGDVGHWNQSSNLQNRERQGSMGHYIYGVCNAYPQNEVGCCFTC